MIETVLGAAVVFAATNVDDVILLAVFFADPRMARPAIVVGQLAGMAALTAVSAIAAYASLTIPPGWTALLGVVPLGMGLVQLRHIWQGARADDDAAEVPRTSAMRSTVAQALAVTAVTIANGGDNLGVYVPLFASDVTIVPAYCVVFAILTGALCAAGYLLVSNLPGRALMSRGGHVVLPVVLIVVGAYILAGARVLLR